MSKIRGKGILFGLVCSISIGALILNGVAPIRAEGSSLEAREVLDVPKPSSSTSKYVPRVGEEVVFYIDDYGFENTDTGLSTSHIPINVFNFEEPTLWAVNNAQYFNKVRVPHMELGILENDEWLYGSARIDVTAFGIFDGANTELKQTVKGEYVEYTRDELLANLGDFNVQAYILSYDHPMRFEGSSYAINKLVPDAPIEYVYDIIDKGVQTNPYVYFNAYGNYSTTGTETIRHNIPRQYLYYETSDISLEVIDAKEFYEPNDEVNVRITIKNNSENIPNSRLVPGIDFGNKEIVKNPVFTPGIPDVNFDIIKDYGNGATTLNPNEEAVFETTITLPENFEEYKNDDGSGIVLTPFLYTSNIYQDGYQGANAADLHYEEREYNTGIELPIKKEFTVTYTDGVEDEVIFEDQVFTVEEGTETPKFVGEVQRAGYTFVEWSPEVEELVSDNVVYTAQWRKDEEPQKPGKPEGPGEEPNQPGESVKPKDPTDQKQPNTGVFNNQFVLIVVMLGSVMVGMKLIRDARVSKKR